MIGQNSPDASSGNRDHADPLSRIGGLSAFLYTSVLIVALFMLGRISLLDAAHAADALPILAQYRTTAIAAGWLFVDPGW